jgi:hypothetical protein
MATPLPKVAAHTDKNYCSLPGKSSRMHVLSARHTLFCKGIRLHVSFRRQYSMDRRHAPGGRIASIRYWRQEPNCKIREASARCSVGGQGRRVRGAGLITLAETESCCTYTRSCKRQRANSHGNDNAGDDSPRHHVCHMKCLFLFYFCFKLIGFPPFEVAPSSSPCPL